MKRMKRLLVITVMCMSIPLTSAWADTEDDIMKTVAGAMQSKDYATVFGEADRWLDGMASGDVPKMGPNYQQLSFIIPFAGYQLVESGDLTLSGDDYRRKVIEPLQAHMKVSQKDYGRNLQILAKAMRKLFELDDTKDPSTENETVWSLWRAVIESQKDEKFQKPVSEKTASLIYQYVLFCLDMVQKTQYPDLYQYRIRHACQVGLGASANLDDAFWIYYEMTYFDGGNIKCGVLYQKAKELLYEEDEEKVRECSKLLKEAIDIARTNKAKAELYRQLADNLATIAKDDAMLEEAVTHARAAYRLNSFDKDIRDLFGSTLLTLSYKAWGKKLYPKAMKLAQEGTTFNNSSDHELYIILAKAQAFQGMKVEAIKNAQKGYSGACLRSKPEDLEFLTNDYKMVLEQFGEGAKFKPCGGRKDDKKAAN